VSEILLSRVLARISLTPSSFARLPLQESIQCPICSSRALYRYGHTRNGKRRFLCLSCGRQFAPEATRHALSGRPPCPRCGRTMHLYKRKQHQMVFRCSNYPDCKTYTTHPVDSGHEG
jgi:transposase-like protein